VYHNLALRKSPFLFFAICHLVTIQLRFLELRVVIAAIGFRFKLKGQALSKLPGPPPFARHNRRPRLQTTPRTTTETSDPAKASSNTQAAVPSDNNIR
jgi:hypothetical protein